MKTGVIFISAVAFLLLTVGAPVSIFATSYYPPLFHPQDWVEPGVKAGQTLHLFHSGTDDVKKAIHENDILTVYRINSSCEVKEVGRIRIIAYIGETYLKAEVIGGEVKSGDIAKKGKVSFLVISARACNQ